MSNLYSLINSKRNYSCILLLYFLIVTPLFAQCPQGLELEKINHSQFKITEGSKWFKSKERPKGIVLVLHGLNLKPSKMDSIAHHFQSNGYDVLRAAFSGHRGSIEEQRKVSAKKWVTEMQLHSCLIQKRSKSLGGVPLFLSAYSLGSLIAMAWQSQQKTNIFSSQIYFAPATFPHWYSKLTNLLFFLRNSFALPSQNLKEYRSQNSTSLGAYRAMSKLRKMIRPLDKKKLNIDTLLFIDPLDELVSIEKMKLFIEKNNLSLWKIALIEDSKPLLKKSYHHLIIDQKTLGYSYWNKFKALSIRHFSH